MAAPVLILYENGWRENKSGVILNQSRDKGKLASRFDRF